MKVSVVEKGGWGANLNRAPTVVDADTLTQADREELERLVRAALDHRGQETGAERKMPGFYTIAIEEDGRQRTISVADIDEEKMPAASALREWVMTRARRR